MVSFTDESGTVRLRGHLSPSPACEALSGNAVHILNGHGDQLTWDTSAGPDTLLDLADPLNPKVRADGFYAVTVTVVGEPLTALGYANVTLTVDTDAAIAYATGQMLPNADGELIAVGVPPWRLRAGQVIAVTVTNQDGAAARDFNILTAVVSRLA